MVATKRKRLNEPSPDLEAVSHFIYVTKARLNNLMKRLHKAQEALMCL